MRIQPLLLSCLVHGSLLAQITLHPGLFALGTADRPTPDQLIDPAFIEGVVIRTQWDHVEPAPGRFDWVYIDSEVASVRRFGKKAVLQVLGSPSWLIDSLGVRSYQYIDQNSYHATYGDTLSDVIPWEPAYEQRVEYLIAALGARYAGDSSIVAVNAVSGSISRNLPEKVADGRNFWEAYNYNPDTLVAVLRRVLDAYMSAFPRTFLWSSMDYVSFETKATGRPRNYVCGEYAKYGTAMYADRFGVWREDISGCTQYPPNAASQWAVMNAYPERTGAQMLWHVQDGPSRMNQCGISDTTKAGVMNAAFEKGRQFGMRYFEIYGADVKDTSLHPGFTLLAEQLRAPLTALADPVTDLKSPATTALSVFPNPFNPETNIRFVLHASGTATLRVYDVTGREVATLVNDHLEAGVIHQRRFDASQRSAGVYFVRLQSGNISRTEMLILAK